MTEIPNTLGSSRRTNPVAPLSTKCASYLEDARLLVSTKPDMSLFRSRQILETVVEMAYPQLTGQVVADRTTVLALLDDQLFRERVPQNIIDAMHLVRKAGNSAVHCEPVTLEEASQGVRRIEQILSWADTLIARRSHKQARPARRLEPAANQAPAANTELSAEMLGSIVVSILGVIMRILALAFAGAGVALLLCFIFAYRALMGARLETADTIMIVGAVAGVLVGAPALLRTIFRKS